MASHIPERISTAFDEAVVEYALVDGSIELRRRGEKLNEFYSYCAGLFGRPILENSDPQTSDWRKHGYLDAPQNGHIETRLHRVLNPNWPKIEDEYCMELKFQQRLSGDEELKDISTEPWDVFILHENALGELMISDLTGDIVSVTKLNNYAWQDLETRIDHFLYHNA